MLSVRKTFVLSKASACSSGRVALEPLSKILLRLNKAQDVFLSFDQQQVDNIFVKVAHAVAKQRVYLARLLLLTCYTTF